MKLRGLKITSILAILSIICLSSCQRDDFDTSLIFDEQGNFRHKKGSFQDEAKENVYDTFVYAYKNGKLHEKKRIIITGKTSYVKKFFYTAKGFIDEITQDGKVAEKKFYELGRITEKHTFYYGIDPGFSPCGGNFIYKYKIVKYITINCPGWIKFFSKLLKLIFITFH